MFGIIGSGSWATALAKILTDAGHSINWWVRNPDTINIIQKKRHNPHYLSTAYFNPSLLNLQNEIEQVFAESETLIIAVPSAYVETVLKPLDSPAFENKKILSAVKGIIPGENVLLNAFLLKHYDLSLEDYFAVLGPCHAEEVAAEKLSYLTFSGIDETKATEIALCRHRPVFLR